MGWKQINRSVACLILLAIVRCIPRIYDFKIISEDVEDMSDIDVVDTATSEVTQTDVDYTRSALGAQKTCEQMMDREASWTIIITVSYTHLTLPTILLV